MLSLPLPMRYLTLVWCLSPSAGASPREGIVLREDTVKQLTPGSLPPPCHYDCASPAKPPAAATRALPFPFLSHSPHSSWPLPPLERCTDVFAPDAQVQEALQTRRNAQWAVVITFCTFPVVWPAKILRAAVDVIRARFAAPAAG